MLKEWPLHHRHRSPALFLFCRLVVFFFFILPPLLAQISSCCKQVGFIIPSCSSLEAPDHTTTGICQEGKIKSETSPGSSRTTLLPLLPGFINT